MKLLLSEPPALSAIDRLALFLDFDGTLVELAPTPDSITPHDGLPARFDTLVDQLDGRLAVVSGRYISDIETYLGQGRYFRAGSHGAELQRPDGSAIGGAAQALPKVLVDLVDLFADTHPGVEVETKPFGLGIHYRGAPQAETAVQAFAAVVQVDHGITLKRGKMVVELLAEPVDKGTAVKTMLSLPEFADCTPVFIGDDVTDEDGFKAVEAAGGFGIFVHDSEVEAERETAARYRLAGVTEVHAWLGL